MVRINLPDLGEGTKEATIKEWFVKEGQHIKEVHISLLVYLRCIVRRYMRSVHRQVGGKNP